MLSKLLFFNFLRKSEVHMLSSLLKFMNMERVEEVVMKLNSTWRRAQRW